MKRKSPVLLAVVLALTSTAALAQTSTTPPAGAGTPPAQGTPMSGMPMGPMQGASGGMPMGMMQMTGQNSMAGHIEGRIAFIKTELKITDAQQPLWEAVADAMRANAKDTTGMPNCMSMMQSPGTLPEKLAACVKAMSTQLEALRKLKTAVEPLYAALSDDQKKTADQLMIGPMGMMSMGMM
jgi:hypothetical protein